MLKDICLNLNLVVNDEVIRFLNEKRVVAKRSPYQRIEESVLDVLKGLKKKDFKIGLISNCSAGEIDGLFSCSLRDFIDEIVLSFQVGMSKPDKEIYALACERLEVKPKECIFVGDGGASELVGATTAGIKAYRASWFHNRYEIGDIFQQVESPMDILDLI